MANYFKHVDFEDHSFKGSNLRCARFINCDLRNADLSDCNLEYVMFINCILKGADLTNSTLEHATFAYVNTKNTVFKNNNVSELQATHTEGIKTVVLNDWLVVAVGNMLAIGCYCFPVEEWLRMDDSQLLALDPKAVKFKKAYKKRLLKMTTG